MKLNYLTKIALICLFTVVLFVSFIACNREKNIVESLGEDDTSVELYDEQTNQIVQRIKKFDKQMNDVKHGLFRSDSYMHIDSALWNIESLFNVTYSFPDRHYVDKKIQELSFNINTYNNMVSVSDVYVLYDDIIESVREAYLNDGFYSDKSLMSIFVEQEESRSGISDVKVVVVSGKTAYNPTNYEPYLYGPFDVDECWYYGELGGSCDDPWILTDAAELIEDTINYFYGYKYDAGDDYRNIYVNLQVISLIGNEYKDKDGEGYYLFYKQNCEIDELYLDVNELNKYYYAEVDVILNFVPNDVGYTYSVPDDHVFMEVDITGNHDSGDDFDVYMHNNFIFYGAPYNVKKEEFGSQKDLLYY